MRRSLYLLAPVVLTAALTIGLTVGDAVSSPGIAEATAVQYNVTATYGPYNGQAAFDTPGSVPDSDAPSVACHNSHDALLQVPRRSTAQPRTARPARTSWTSTA